MKFGEALSLPDFYKRGKKRITEEYIASFVDKYGDMVFRIAFVGIGIFDDTQPVRHGLSAGGDSVVK